ncbi:MAG TPA: peptidylprolyl isomerase [Sulfuricaulis sp.]|nr:peptidylprolyl isomerase [Sulfuricaulis sp.]
MKWTETRSLLREPLLHFFLIGAAMFILFGWRGNSVSLPGGQTGTPTAQIVVSRDALDQMYNLFAKTWQRPPTEDEQKKLIEDFVRNEIYYREAIAIGLDRDDEVLKRRLRQKMEFIYEDITSWVEPTDTDLMAYMKKHRERYLTDPQMSFRQVYISTNKRGTSAESDARQIIAQLTGGADPDSVGDRTLLEPEVPLSPLWDIRKQFGDEFGNSLLELRSGRWEGPIRSGVGLHAVFVRERVSGRLPDLNGVREMVMRDWAFERQKELKDAAYAKIRERYTVTVEKPTALIASAVAVANTKATPR